MIFWQPFQMETVPALACPVLQLSHFCDAYVEHTCANSLYYFTLLQQVLRHSLQCMHTSILWSLADLDPNKPSKVCSLLESVPSVTVTLATLDTKTAVATAN